MRTAIVVERRALVRGETGRGRFLDELLVPALEGAVALPDRDHGAVAVGEQLDLDVTCRAELALEIDAPSPKAAAASATPRPARPVDRPRARPAASRVRHRRPPP